MSDDQEKERTRFQHTLLTLQAAADALAQAVRKLYPKLDSKSLYSMSGLELSIYDALAAYERAKAEAAKPVAAWMRECAVEMADALIAWENQDESEVEEMRGGALKVIVKHCPHAPEEPAKPGDWMREGSDLLCKLAGSATQDDGVDPESTWIELSADEWQAFRRFTASLHFAMDNKQTVVEGGYVIRKPIGDEHRQCAICGFIVDLSKGHSTPSIEFGMQGRGKHAPAKPKREVSAEVMATELIAYMEENLPDSATCIETVSSALKDLAGERHRRTLSAVTIPRQAGRAEEEPPMPGQEP